jgi:DNA-binding NarL/FixJ family response regulator
MADDHPIFRFGLRKFLESQPDFCVVGEAADGLETVQMTERLRPDILLLDLAMPRLHGMEALRELSATPNGVRIIVLTASVDKPQIVEALQLGARGIVLKESATELLLNGIRAVMAGHYWVGREAVPDLVSCLRALIPVGAKPEKSERDKFGLTPREREIVSAVALGNMNKDVAQMFSISEDTVKHHLTSIFNKLKVSNRLELALFAIRKGLVGP